MANMNDQKKENIEYIYKFYYKGGSKQSFRILLDGETLNLIDEKDQHSNLAEWAKLDFHQCKNCPLKPENHPYCPIAANLTYLIPQFTDKVSFEQVLLRVESKERVYEHETTIQKGLSGIIGIYMVTSGCPVMDVLKPMVRYHLPFATIEETVYRAASMYLVAQYFRKKNTLDVDWTLDGLAKAYQEIQTVNIGMTGRMREISQHDASPNAVIVLDVFAKELPFSILDGLHKIEYLFSDFLKNNT